MITTLLIIVGVLSVLASLVFAHSVWHASEGEETSEGFRFAKKAAVVSSHRKAAKVRPVLAPSLGGNHHFHTT